MDMVSERSKVEGRIVLTSFQYPKTLLSLNLVLEEVGLQTKIDPRRIYNMISHDWQGVDIIWSRQTAPVIPPTSPVELHWHHRSRRNCCCICDARAMHVLQEYQHECNPTHVQMGIKNVICTAVNSSLNKFRNRQYVNLQQWQSSRKRDDYRISTSSNTIRGAGIISSILVILNKQ